MTEWGGSKLTVLDSAVESIGSRDWRTLHSLLNTSRRRAVILASHPPLFTLLGVRLFGVDEREGKRHVLISELLVFKATRLHVDVIFQRQSTEEFDGLPSLWSQQ